jgi:hypothetical protein
MVGNHKDKTCISSALFPEPEPDRTPVEVLAQESYNFTLSSWKSFNYIAFMVILFKKINKNEKSR